MPGATYICGPCLGGHHDGVTWSDELDADGFRLYECGGCGATWKTKESDS